MKPKRQTEIVATLGPSSSTYEMIRALHDAGATIFRLGFSHDTYDEHREKMAIIRRIEKETGKKIEVLADIQGPKLRIGTFKNGAIALQPGMKIRFDLDRTPGDETRVCCPHPEIVNALKPGDKLALGNGTIGMHVTEAGDGFLVAEVDHGKKLSDKTGIAAPGVSLPFAIPTEKDKEDMRLAISLGIRTIVLSFVQNLDDVEAAEKEIELIKQEQGITDAVKVDIKVETWAALCNFDELLTSGHRMMLGRGDLGVAIPRELLPLAQENLLDRAREAGVDVIVATHMLRSMRDSPVPTRAEDGDVARAVMSHAYAVMLSAETSAGQYPVEAVAEMDRVCRAAEEWRTPADKLTPRVREDFLKEVFKAAANDDVKPAKAKPPVPKKPSV